MKKHLHLFVLLFLTVVLTLPAHCTANSVTDAWGRQLVLPQKIDRIICSGPGALRLATYFQVQDRVVGVDDREGRVQAMDARPYAIAVPDYKDLPVFGGFRGFDDPEKVLGLDPAPQVIFKTYGRTGHDPVKLQTRTGIPVVVLEYGDLGKKRDDFFTALKIMGEVLDKQDRAHALINFFETQIEELNQRTADIAQPKTCFVGGIAFRGPHGFASTEPFYPPFTFVNVENVASRGLPKTSTLRHTIFSKETLLMADPDILFLDLSTLQMGENQGGLFELKHDPVIRALTAVSTSEVYTLLPYNWYTGNLGSILADAWFIGKAAYPQAFEDIDPAQKADEIYTFLFGVPVFDELNARFGSKVFTRLNLEQ